MSKSKAHNYKKIGKEVNTIVVFDIYHYTLKPKLQVPEELLDNVTNQIPGVRPVPKTLDDYTEEEREQFPKMFDYKENFVVDHKGLDDQVDAKEAAALAKLFGTPV